VFSDILLTRRNEMWRGQNIQNHSVDDCENTLLTESSPFDHWHCCENWQRKLSNKLNAKYFATSCGIKVAKLLWFGKDPKSIPFDLLPDTFVVKSSNGWCSEQILPVYNGVDVFTGKLINRNEIIAFFEKILSNKKFKHAYIFVEEFLQPSIKGKLPIDYKLWCFNGQVKFIQVMDELNKTHIWYTKEWNPVRDQMHIEFARGKVEPPPSSLKRLIVAAEKLAEAYAFKFVRIDLYIIEGEIYFGEFTHTPYVGATRMLYTPYANSILAKYWEVENA
jgi:hypothetical protein